MPFVKGKSGNPGGRPKRDWTWASLYEEELKSPLKDDKGREIDAHKAVVMRIIRMAVAGDIAAIKELTQRMDGMPSQDVNNTGNVTLNVEIVRHKVTDGQDKV